MGVARSLLANRPVYNTSAGDQLNVKDPQPTFALQG
jgi:hypothetical protein